MRIAIIDDEPMYRERLKRDVEKEMQVLNITTYEIDTFTSAEEFLSVWSDGYYHLVFVDIFMGEMDGVELSKRIREEDKIVEIVFCSTSNDFAAQSYEVDASYYLTKPITEENLDRMLKKINLNSISQNQLTTLPDGRKLMLSRIAYTDYYNHVITFKLKDHPDVRSRISMMQAEEILLRHSFFIKVNRGSIVNLNMVEEIKKDRLTMYDGTELVIPRRKLKEVTAEYTDFRIEKLRSKKL